VELHTESIVKHQGLQVAAAVAQCDQIILRALRPDDLPLEELMLAVRRGGELHLDLTLRINREGCPEIAISTISTGVPIGAPGDQVRSVNNRYTHPLLSANSATKLRPASISNVLRFGVVEVDFLRMELLREGKRIEVTAHEFKTLRYLANRPEEAISRDELLEHVWGYKHYPTTRAVDNRILKLRKKVERDPTNPSHLLTVHGVGYKFVP